MWENENQGSTKTRPKIKKPSFYRVIMHNDDYTTMEFVVEVLVSIFEKEINDATKIMLDVHQRGHGNCGIYPRDIAETKIDQVHKKARQAGYPLRCSMEKN